jgi:ribosomal subunit interface protein
MIQRIEVTGLHTEVTEEIYKYVLKKIGRLDQYMSRHARQSVHVEVKLKDSTVKKRQQSTCEVIMHLPHGTITTKETTLNAYAAIDIVEAKLKNQLKKYKDKHDIRFHRKVVNKFRRQSGT